jgi:hypothetical protein
VLQASRRCVTAATEDLESRKEEIEEDESFFPWKKMLACWELVTYD